MRHVLDTHVLLWWLDGSRRLAPAQRRAVARASAENPLLLSDISLWEIGVLVEKGRLRLGLPLREWLERASAPPLVRRCSVSPAVVAEIANLPPGFHRDPADRIIVATARIHGATLLTSDRLIIDEGVVTTL